MIVADAKMMVNTKDSIIVSNESGKLVVVKGLQNYMVKHQRCAACMPKRRERF